MPLWSIHADPLPETYFESEIDNISEKVKDPQKEIIKLKAAQTNKKEALEKALKEIKASNSLTEHVRLIQEYVTLRVYRKNAVCKANYYQLPLLYESGKRLGLSAEDVKLLSYPEIIAGLTEKVTKISLEKLVKKRKFGWAIFVINEKFRDVTGAKDIIETMERYQIVSPSNLMQRTVKGKVACSGKATGTVKVITRLSDINKVEEGDVLVAKMTTPDYVVAIHNVVAIITDEGGLTCHAAIVSRELNIPCIIGTKNATQILSDGDIVEVDANEGIVRVVENVDFPQDVKSFSGKTIYNGKVTGPARIVLDVSDFTKIQEGDILIAPQTTPEYLSLLYRVNGFVVDEESTTSHAVLYGKALRIPSMMGTKFARYAINDGEMVELDATNGTLTKLNLNK